MALESDSEHQLPSDPHSFSETTGSWPPRYVSPYLMSNRTFSDKMAEADFRIRVGSLRRPLVHHVAGAVILSVFNLPVRISAIVASDEVLTRDVVAIIFLVLAPASALLIVLARWSFDKGLPAMDQRLRPLVQSRIEEMHRTERETDHLSPCSARDWRNLTSMQSASVTSMVAAGSRQLSYGQGANEGPLMNSQRIGAAGSRLLSSRHGGQASVSAAASDGGGDIDHSSGVRHVGQVDKKGGSSGLMGSQQVASVAPNKSADPVAVPSELLARFSRADSIQVLLSLLANTFFAAALYDAPALLPTLVANIALQLTVSTPLCALHRQVLVGMSAVVGFVAHLVRASPVVGFTEIHVWVPSLTDGPGGSLPPTQLGSMPAHEFLLLLGIHTDNVFLSLLKPIFDVGSRPLSFFQPDLDKLKAANPLPEFSRLVLEYSRLDADFVLEVVVVPALLLLAAFCVSHLAANELDAASRNRYSLARSAMAEKSKMKASIADLHRAREEEDKGVSGVVTQCLWTITVARAQVIKRITRPAMLPVNTIGAHRGTSPKSHISGLSAAPSGSGETGSEGSKQDEWAKLIIGLRDVKTCLASMRVSMNAIHNVLAGSEGGEENARVFKFLEVEPRGESAPAAGNDHALRVSSRPLGSGLSGLERADSRMQSANFRVPTGQSSRRLNLGRSNRRAATSGGQSSGGGRSLHLTALVASQQATSLSRISLRRSPSQHSGANAIRGVATPELWTPAARDGRRSNTITGQPSFSRTVKVSTSGNLGGHSGGQNSHQPESNEPLSAGSHRVAHSSSHRSLCASRPFALPASLDTRNVGVDWDCDILGLADECHSRHLSPLLVVGFAVCHEVLTEHCPDLTMSPQTLRQFLVAVDSNYTAQLYHNHAHAAQVCSHMMVFMRNIGLWGVLSDVEVMACVIGALCHDVGHFGHNNMFCTKTGHELALIYNDRSPLEMMHTAMTFQLMQDEERNICADFGWDVRTAFRAALIELILSTDMKRHFEAIKSFTQKRESDGFDPMGDDKLVALCLAMKASDIGHSALPWDQHEKWSVAVTREFFAQGDEERALGLEISPLCDREEGSHKVPSGQQGFLNFVSKPLFRELELLQELIIGQVAQVGSITKSLGGSALSNSAPDNNPVARANQQEPGSAHPPCSSSGKVGLEEAPRDLHLRLAFQGPLTPQCSVKEKAIGNIDLNAAKWGTLVGNYVVE